jgi:hypothetical protein
MLLLASSDAASAAAEVGSYIPPSSLPIARRKSAPGFGACGGGGEGFRGGGGGTFEACIGNKRSASLIFPQLAVGSQVPSFFFFSMINSARSVYESIILLQAFGFNIGHQDNQPSSHVSVLNRRTGGRRQVQVESH